MKYLALILISIVLSACTLTQNMAQVETREPEPTAVPDTIEQALIDVALVAERALETLNKRKGGPDYQAKPRLISEELLQKTSVPWIGPIGAYLKKMAAELNYEFQETGKKPYQPIIVDMNDQENSYITLLRNAGIQASDQANVVLNAKEKQIEVIYAQ